MQLAGKTLHAAIPEGREQRVALKSDKDLRPL